MTVIDSPSVQGLAEGSGPIDLEPATSTSLGAPGRPRPPVGLWLSVGWLAVIVLAAAFAPILPLEPYDAMTGSSRTPPGWQREFLGTDTLGRSLLSRVVYGARVSLTVAIVSVVIAIVVGSLLGMLAGYFRGAIDRLLSVLVDSVLALPGLVLLIAVTAAMTPSLRSLIIALSILVLPAFARLTRATTATLSQREYVRAARAMGATHRRIMLREILPGVLPGISSYSFLVVAVLIAAEGSLSFLGFGIPPPQPSWGGMIAAGRQNLQEFPHLVFVPALAMLLTVWALNIVGDHVRRRADLQGSRLS